MSNVGKDSLLERVWTVVATESNPDLGPARRAGTKSVAQLDEELKPIWNEHSVSASQQGLIRAAALIWHDALDPAHEIVQHASGGHGAYLHGIIHRREPDYSNARYWFHRVGRHASFPDLARRVREHFGAQASGPIARLSRGNDWDAMAFIDACSRAADQPDSSDAEALRQAQRMEFLSLLEAICAK